MLEVKDLNHSEQPTQSEPDTQQHMAHLEAKDTEVQAQIPIEKPIHPFKLVLNLIYSAFIIFAVVQLVKWPSEAAGRSLWDEEVESFTRQSIYEELVNMGLPSEISILPQTTHTNMLDFTSTSLSWKEFEKRANSELLGFLLFDTMNEGKKVYLYEYVENWSVSLDDKVISTVKTTTAAIAQPKLFSDYEFYRYLTDTVYPSDLQNLAAQYQVQAKQRDLADRVSITGAWVETTGEYWSELLFIVEYAWTNQSDSYVAPIYNVTVDAYQNDIKLSKSYGYGYEAQYSTLNEIAPGKTLTYTQAYYIENQSAPVTVRITDYLSAYEDFPAEITETYILE